MIASHLNIWLQLVVDIFIVNIATILFIHNEALFNCDEIENFSFVKNFRVMRSKEFIS